MKRINLKTCRAGNLRLHVVPVLVWLAATVGVVGLFYHRSLRFEVVGIAQGQVRQIAATCMGRLRSVPIQLFQEVKKGDTLAVIDTVLDNEPLQAQLDTVSAEIHHLKAQLVETQERLVAEADIRQSNWVSDKRRFSVDIENARIRILELKTLIETDRIMLEDLQVDSRIVQRRLDTDPLAPYELQKVKVQHRALVKKIEENQRLLAQAEQDLKESQHRHDEFARRQLQHPPVDNALEVIREAIKVQEQLVAELLARRVPLVLKSPMDGVVIQLHGRARDVVLRRPGEFVLRRPGEVVLAGDPIISISSVRSTRIVAYAAREQLGRIREGMAVQLIKSTEPAQIARSQITYIAPTLERMPEWLWQVPNIPQWGHPLRIEIPPGLNLMPGEAVGIRGL